MKRKFVTRGQALPYAMLFFTVVTGVTVGAANLADTTNRVALAATNKSEADILAESGVNAIYDAIWRQMQATQTYPTSIGPTLLGTATSISPVKQGTYTGSIVNVTATTKTVSSTQIESDYTFTVMGVGVAANGTTSSVAATFTATMVTSKVQTSNAAMFLPAAIQSNTGVSFFSDMGIRTYDPTNSNLASIYGTQGVSWAMANGSKNTSNPNCIDAQGQILVPNNPAPTFFNQTNSYFGLFNQNGSQNFICAGDPGSGVPPNNVTPCVPRTYPTSTQVGQWQSQWLSSIQSNTAATELGPTASSSVGFTNPVGKVITAPGYINGDLVVSGGDCLKIQPTDPNPANNVLYVNGNITNNAQLFNLGCTIVFTGTYTDTPSSEYRVDLQGSPYTLSQALNNATLMSTSSADNAISISSNCSDTTGLIYAANGGVRVTGNAELTGAIISGGAAATGGVVVAPSNGQSFVVHLAADCFANKTAFSSPITTSLGLSKTSASVGSGTISTTSSTGLSGGAGVSGGSASTSQQTVVTPFTPGPIFGWATL